MQNQKVLILDFGGQYNQLIARRVRENNVYCEVHPYDMSLDAIRAYDPIGIIFTGGPQSVYAEGSPHADLGVYTLGVPILGICYGCQLMAHNSSVKMKLLIKFITANLCKIISSRIKEHCRYETFCTLHSKWFTRTDLLVQFQKTFFIVC